MLILNKINTLRKPMYDKTEIYIEYEQTKEAIHNIDYLIHFSLQTNEEAEKLFIRMKESWGLPVRIKKNRIILSTFIQFGTSLQRASATNEACLAINFRKSIQAQEFCNLVKSANANSINSIRLPKITLPTGCRVDFPDLLHPNYSLANRKKSVDETINQCSFISWALTQKDFPNDLSFFIGLNFFNLLSKTNHFLEITNQFKLSNEIFEQPYQKIDCTIRYSLAESKGKNDKFQFNIHLVCSNNEDAFLLEQNIKKAKIGTLENVERENKEIKILPYYQKIHTNEPNNYGHMSAHMHSGSYTIIDKKTGEIKVGINFRGPIGAAVLNSFVNFNASLKEKTIELETTESPLSLLSPQDFDNVLQSELKTAASSDLKAKKTEYLELLTEHLAGLTPEFKKDFALYLLNKTDHVLKKERHFFRFYNYSNQTLSMHQVVKLLLSRENNLVQDNQFDIGEHHFSRHRDIFKN
jgi:hypothetical protein